MEFTEKLTIAPCAASDWRNTMRLIDADALKKELEVWVVAINQPQFYNREEALYIIDSAPTADAVPVVHGRWILLGKNEHDYETSVEEKCSLCGRYVYRYDTELQDNYCPNCGARMDGGADHEAD